MFFLTHRISLFGDFNRFAPTTTNIIKWSQAFQNRGYDFLPNIIDTQMPLNLFIPIQPNAQDKRIQFASQQSDLFVRILANRIDAEYISFESDDPKRELTKKTEELNVLMEILLNELDNPKGIRLAFYVESMLPEKKENGFKDVYTSQNLGITVPKAKDYVEWMHRFNAHTVLKTGLSEEVCNSIISFESAVLNTQDISNGKPLEMKGLHISADINTLAERIEERFDISNLKEFCLNSQTLYLNVCEQICELFKEK